MCGRFAIHTSLSVIARDYFGVQVSVGDTLANYNVTPGQQIAAIRMGSGGDDGEGLIFDRSYWGFRPKGAGEDAPLSINARAETVASSRYFSHSFLNRRCLIPANGWYEWQKTASGKQPFYVTPREDVSDPLLFFAGIWTPTGQGVSTCCAIITEPAAREFDEVHHRQPVILDAQTIQSWISPEIQDRNSIKALVRRRPIDQLTWFPVSTDVNKPTNNNESLIIPADRF
tara:strand:+ start:29254 stop:29940 length:687 start_codon:yes stop_codon:yes gene_type:complete